LTFAIILGGGCLAGLLGQPSSIGTHAVTAQPPPSIAKPANVWRVYWRPDRVGNRQVSKTYYVTTADQALAAFRAEHGPAVMVVCMAHAYYERCEAQ
jgi:hypothetical protein